MLFSALSIAAPTSPCAEGEAVCDLTWDVTGNRRLAEWSDVLIGVPLAIIGLVLLGLVARWLLHRLVDRVARRAERGVLPERVENAVAARRKQRAATMAGLLKSIITFVIVAIVGTMVLSELGVDIAPIIASAGIIGIALGFGAQSLVKDFLAGIFIFIEDQYGVGDVVDVGEANGTVEVVTLRMTRLRDINGTVWYVPNGEIVRVGNKSQNWSRAVVDVSVGYGEDLARVQRVLREVATDLWQDDEYNHVIIEEPEVTGVEMLAPDSVTIRVMVKTAPLEQWAVARALRQRIKARFDHEGIEIPFAQRVVWHREDRRHSSDQGPAPAVATDEG
ncbi:mechanosensitive ion channel family protein [Pimelobacter simplex]|uniref:Mechanosensitive ion channel family protein n=1 Tax=Nocardioides simplex TaxID=2045 RepID=A0A0A1DQZ6_NOCSI|nr:mechanosensitive ion channel family protein [Pimelobacter simplex]AIY19799.2 Potassium efflux system KefA protein [Pimelobacter simplex]KAB2809199.1 mechanosensitive ion channel family protein [Pimelobacter simplex]MCG8151875.1 mechanosensitive ion channel [Pimelobacter simplex]SFM56648.1 small conductance mechanosensitive channel [Pimelobacter simplex]GEB12632.1 mechanosensitive ion channel protein MscS [Pimelobacter simplex]